MERKESWEYGTHGPDDPGRATIVDTVTPYAPTITWQAVEEPTEQWALDEPSGVAPVWRHGLMAIGVLAAVTTGFFLGRGAAAPEKAPLPTVSVSPSEGRTTAGPSPSIPVVLPEPPDLPSTLPPSPPVASHVYALPAPPAHAVVAPPRRAPSAQPFAQAVRPVPTRRTRSRARQLPVRPEAEMAPPVNLYGARRPDPPTVVASWQVQVPSLEPPRSF